MSEKEIKEKNIRNYFTKFPKWTILAIIFGVITLIIGVGIILIIAGIIGIYLYMKPKLTDQQFDKWLDESIEKLEKRSIEKLGIDPSEIKGKSLSIVGPVLWDVRGVDKKDLVFKKGKDDLVRFGIYDVSIIQLTEKFMGTYQCTYNFLKNVPLNEKTDEYYYKDIVTVSTNEISTSYELPNGQKLTFASTFVIKIPSGDAVEVVLWDPALEKYTDGKPKLRPTTRAEETIAAIRQKLRQNK